MRINKTEKTFSLIGCRMNKKWQLGYLETEDCSIKFHSKHSTVILLSLLWNLMEQALTGGWLLNMITISTTRSWTTETRWLNPKFFATQIQIQIPILNNLSSSVELDILFVPPRCARQLCVPLATGCGLAEQVYQQGRVAKNILPYGFTVLSGPEPKNLIFPLSVL